MTLELLKQTKTRTLSSFLKATLIVPALISGINLQAQSWTAVKNIEPNSNQGVILLLTDGTLIAHNATGGTYGTGWDKLTPDITGSYVNGVWTTLASMNFDRTVFPSQVLPSGKVFVAGGEYGSGATKGEVYDPVANKWTNTGAVTSNQNIYDGNSEILANGNILVGAQNGLNPSFDDLFFNPGTNAWSTAPIAPLNHDESAWLKLPDGSILFVGIASTKSCRYIPATNSWVSDANVPVSLYDTYGEESGAAFMLPNGKAIFFGAAGPNAIYTPSGTSSPGTWAAAASFPKIQGKQMGQPDAPGCMEPNGKILLAVSPIGTSVANEFLAPTYFVEYNYLTNTFAQIKLTIPGIGGDSIPNTICQQASFLLLPTGQVLMGINQSTLSQNYWVYNPAGADLAAGKPVLNSIYQTACGSNYYMTGKLFNGISEGAGFGDDWQMSTNYPLVRIKNGTNTYYAKTTNWNRIGAVQTDSLEDTAQFTLPTLPIGTDTLYVVVNGIPSSPYVFTPYLVDAIVTSNVSCNGANNGSAQATAQGGTTPYTYSWSNGSTTTSAGSSLSAGSYTITVTDKLGCTTTTSVTITQPTVLSIPVTITSQVSCNGGTNGALSSSTSGGTIPYVFSWSNGGTKSTNTGLTAGSYTVTVTDKHGCTATASATITQPIAISATKGMIAAWVSNCNGSAWVTVSGGTSPYTYAWNPGGGTTDSISALCAGSYCCTITDKKGCTDIVCVSVPTGLQNLSESSSPITIYPDPNNGYFTVTGITKGQIVELYNYVGQQLSTITADDATMHFDISTKPSGVYLVRVITKDGNLVSQAKLLKIN